MNKELNFVLLLFALYCLPDQVPISLSRKPGSYQPRTLSLGEFRINGDSKTVGA